MTSFFGPRPLRLLTAAALLAASLGCVSDSGPDADVMRERAVARRNVGIDHITHGRLANGIRELRYAVTLLDDDVLTHLWLGEAYRRRGRLDEALEHTERALELDPEHHEARLNLSVLCMQLERWQEAIDHSQLLIDDPTFPSAWRALNNRGYAQLKLGRIDEARESFVEALEFRPDFWPAMLNLGIIEQYEGDYLDSLRYYGEVVERNPGPNALAEAHYRMAEAYVSLGERERAMHHLMDAIEQSPHGRWGTRSREYLRRLR